MTTLAMTNPKQTIAPNRLQAVAYILATFAYFIALMQIAAGFLIP
ncbi:hypothetical protein [Methylobacterium oryzisoli]